MRLDPIGAVGPIRSVDIRTGGDDIMSMDDIILKSTGQATASLTVQDLHIDRIKANDNLTDGRTLLHIDALQTERNMLSQIGANMVSKLANAVNKLVSS